MEPNFARILLLLLAFAIAWIAARAILSVIQTASTDNMKASWIALIICLPIIGAALFWLCSGSSTLPHGTPAQREALLKARMNRDDRAA